MADDVCRRRLMQLASSRLPLPPAQYSSPAEVNRSVAPDRNWTINAHLRRLSAVRIYPTGWRRKNQLLTKLIHFDDVLGNVLVRELTKLSMSFTKIFSLNFTALVLLSTD